MRVRARESEETEVAYRLDPDLKDGHGGLRDVQSLWWANAAGMHMSAGDEADLTRCYDMLLRARVALHLATERPGDVLRLEEQDATAVTGRVDRRRQPDGLGGGWRAAPSRGCARRTGDAATRHEAEAGRSGGRSGVWCWSTVRSNSSPGADPAADQTLGAQGGGRRGAQRRAHRSCHARPAPSRDRRMAGQLAGRGDRRTGGAAARGPSGDSGARGARPARAVQPPAAGVGAGSFQAATQRLSPVHRRSAPVGSGGERGRDLPTGSAAPTCW